MRTPAERITQFSKQEIDRLFQTSNRLFKNNAVTFLAAPRSKKFARMLLVVPKATGIAVVRNKLRRRLKDIFRREALSQQLPVDLVIIARKPIMAYSFDELKELINKVVKKIS
jgi:ribonuclease P protein component